jgi:sulfite reductase (ferredoxin)
MSSTTPIHAAADTDDEVFGSKVEHAKAGSRQLRSTIAEELTNGEPTFSPEAVLTLKFHGTYAQDDRDTRTARRKAGEAPDAFQMVRTGIPGGVLTSDQYLVMDKLADSIGNGTLRITTRQDIQFHRVYKQDLHELISTLNNSGILTLAACGDVVRNTTACPAPLPGRARAELVEWAQRVHMVFKPRTRGYYGIWMDGERVVTAEAPEPGESGTADEEPLYGRVYLPRKFKIGFSAPGDNCTDVLINDCAVIPLVEDDHIRAFTLCIGGGMGKTHAKPETYPRLATPLTTVPPEELLATIEAVVKLHRDHGNRENREHARLKYVVDDLGDERVRELIADYLGHPVRDAEPVVLDHADDHLGWHEQSDGAWFLGVKVASGRIADVDDVRVRSGVRAVVERFGATVRFTPREDVLLCDIEATDRPRVDALLAEHGVQPARKWLPIALNSFACPALPTCGLALTESERALPALLEELHETLDELGLADVETHVRMTGCPNGCARPYSTEMAFVGRGKNRYDIHLGGERVGVRMNEIFCENAPRDQLVPVLRPVFERYAAERNDGEEFGNWCHRVGVATLRAELGTEEWVRKPRAAKADA